MLQTIHIVCVCFFLFFFFIDRIILLTTVAELLTGRQVETQTWKHEPEPART